MSGMGGSGQSAGADAGSAANDNVVDADYTVVDDENK